MRRIPLAVGLLLLASSGLGALALQGEAEAPAAPEAAVLRGHPAPFEPPAGAAWAPLRSLLLNHTYRLGVEAAGHVVLVTGDARLPERALEVTAHPVGEVSPGGAGDRSGTFSVFLIDSYRVA